MNLLTNALDATPRGGTVSFSVRTDSTGDEPRVMIDVSDTGCGMTEEVLQHLFTPFYTTKRISMDGEKFGGSGLGLYSVRVFVESWGGEVRCVSSPGAGTTFTITLPYAGGAAELDPSGREPTSALSSHS